MRPQLPESLAALRELSHNLRWSYDRATQMLFERANPQGWAEGIRDPMRLLAQADIAHLEALGNDHEYTSDLDAAARSLEATSTLKGAALNPESGTPGADRATGEQFGHLVAYFSPEFGITEAINQYSGGLGVLAGDHLKAAGELGVPLVAVGLFYRHGYFHQSLTVDGWQTEHFEDVDPHTLALTEMESRISVDLADEEAQLRIWRAQLGPTPIYLLDADLPENSHEVRLITDRLYGGDVEHRLRQEIVLGIGGVRALAALGEPADVFHTNEGHAGFMGLERIRMLMESDSLSVVEAFEAVRAGSVFTTHTPVPAGIDRFPRRLIELYFSEWARTVGLSMDELMAVGHEPNERRRSPIQHGRDGNAALAVPQRGVACPRNDQQDDVLLTLARGTHRRGTYRPCDKRRPSPDMAQPRHGGTARILARVRPPGGTVAPGNR